MSSNNNSNPNFGVFLKNFSALILAVISFISGVYGFVKLFGDKDAGLITLISLIVGILLLLSVCLYYARFWKPEKHDKAHSAFEPSLSDEQVKAHLQKEQLRKLVRRLASTGLILLPILSILSFVSWQYFQSLPTKDIIVLVADFEGPDLKNYRVTKNISDRLSHATKKYSDVRIQRLNKVISESEIARSEGKKHKATIVIWGDYGVTDVAVQISTRFEVMHPSKELPELGKQANGMPQESPIAELKSFKLQTRLSKELSYLSLFTLRITRYTAADWDGAIARFSDALNQIAETTSALDQSLVNFYRGTAYLQKGDYNRALADFSQTLKLQPNFAQAYSNRGLIYLTKSDYDRAFADFNQTLKLQPNFALAYSNRGLIYYTKSNYDLAIADFTQALKQKLDSDVPQLNYPKIKVTQPIIPNNKGFSTTNFITFEFGHYLIYSNRGIVYLAKGDNDRAIADFEQAIKLKPDSVVPYFNRASAYSVKSDYDRAIADINQVIKLQPDLAIAYLKRASIHYFKNDYNLSLADINQAIKLQPDLAFAYGIRGEIYRKKGDYDRAIADFNQALKLQPDSAEIFNSRGVTYSRKGDYTDAIADFNQAIKLKSDYAEAYIQRAITYKKQGDFARTIADFNQALKVKPDHAEAYNARGFAYAENGDYDRAISDINQALKLKPDEANYYDSRGFAYAGKGNYNRAMTDYNQALKLKPDADYAYYHRGIAYKNQGNKDKAITDFKKTLELTKDSKRRQDAEKQLQELGAK